jgi:DNA-binding YbaB/EbfC family protein
MFKGNMAKMLKQAQDMQKRIESVQAELSDTVIDVDSGGGMVRININGKLELLELNIDSEVLKEDKEIIEDLIIAAVNKGISKAQSDSQDKMNSVTGGMLSGLNIPGI